MALKRILRYLKRTLDFGLWFPRTNYFNLIGYTDTDFGRCQEDQRSTSGNCQLFGNCIVYWFSKKQPSIALSTTEAEYMVVENCCAQIMWIKHSLVDFRLNYQSVPIFCDNTSTINLTKNSIHHSRTKTYRY